jgi:hypothetical protein
MNRFYQFSFDRIICEKLVILTDNNAKQEDHSSLARAFWGVSCRSALSNEGRVRGVEHSYSLKSFRLSAWVGTVSLEGMWNRFVPLISYIGCSLNFVDFFILLLPGSKESLKCGGAISYYSLRSIS